MKIGKGLRVFLVTMVMVVAGVSPALAQVAPWITFTDDPVSPSVCDVVNASNAELLVIQNVDPGVDRLAIVTGQDVILQDTEVSLAGDVFFRGEPAGFITFAEDGNGLRSLWWLSLTGQVVSVDGFTGEPTVTNMLPTDFFDLSCDGCDFWDDLSICAPPVDSDPVDHPPVTINFCGSDITIPMASTVLGLLTMGLVDRRVRRVRS